MTRRVLLSIVVVTMVVMLAGGACGTQTPTATQQPSTAEKGTLPQSTLVSKTTPVSTKDRSVEELLRTDLTVREVSTVPVMTIERDAETLTGFSHLSQVPHLNANEQSGIWVTGRGEITVEPDLAVLNTGVEARASTVSEANRQAGKALNQIVQVLYNRGIQEKDIQTSFFSISPEYRWDDREKKQKLVGYIVANQVSVKIRDLDNTGLIIDEVAAAGGDLTRIQGISFTTEQTSALGFQVREIAVTNALSKAQQFAQLTGVQIGSLLFISESDAGVPRIESVGMRAAFAEDSLPPTPISGGELTISITVQAVFAIVQ